MVRLLLAVALMLPAATALAQSAFDPYRPLTGAAEALSGDLLTVSGTMVKLYAVDAPDLGQVCRTRDGRSYDCGAAARNILQRLIGGKDIDCILFSKLPSGANVGTCALQGNDLGAYVVLTGWGFSERALSDRYEPHEAKAQAGRRGVWSGEAVRPWVWRQEQADGAPRR